MVLSEDVQGNLPDGKDAATYAEATGIESIPVTSDPQAKVVLDATPWDAKSRPGKCALSPAMEILACWVGKDNDQGFEAIKVHAGL